MVKIEDTNLANDVVMATERAFKYGFLPEAAALKCFKVYVVAITRYLATVKNTKTPTAFTITDTEGKFIVGAVVEYNDTASEEDGTTGNWNYYWTFDENDIPKEAVVYDIKNKQTHKIIIKSAWSDMNAEIAGEEALIILGVTIFEVLKKHLVEKASADEVYELESDGVFKCQSQIENGEVAMSIIPDGLIKKMIKDDAALEAEKVA